MTKDKLLKTIGGIDSYLNYYGEVIIRTKRIKHNGEQNQYIDAAIAATAVMTSVRDMMSVLENYRAIAIKQLTGQDPISIPVNQSTKPKLRLIKGGVK